MDNSKVRGARWRKVESNFNLVIERAKHQRSPSPHAKISSGFQSTPLPSRTIGAMFAHAQINRTVDPLQLTETALPQSSPQLAGPSPISKRPVRFQLKHLTIGTSIC
jgi:hypothetical protein